MFVLTDSPETTDTGTFVPIVVDGQNLAFLFNTSSAAGNKTDLLECLLGDLINLTIKAAYDVIGAEEVEYYQTLASEDGYKPSINDRNDNIYKKLKVTNQYF